MITVTTKDHDCGDEETMELQPDDYVLVLGEKMILAHVNSYANGTRILTIKRATGER